MRIVGWLPYNAVNNRQPSHDHHEKDLVNKSNQEEDCELELVFTPPFEHTLDQTEDVDDNGGVDEGLHEGDLVSFRQLLSNNHKELSVSNHHCRDGSNTIAKPEILEENG